MRVDTLDKPLDLTIQDREALFGALKATYREYDDLQSTRNKLLHATWLIGYPDHDDPTCERFDVQKYAATAMGLAPIESLPKRKEELEHLTKRCEMTRSWIAAVHACLGGPFLIKETFKREGNDWCLFINERKMPLLEKRMPPSD